MPTIIKKNILLIIILLTAFLVRSYKISSTPALNPDEAAIGYNAYSLLETGKDEHGTGWPLHFKSFGDFKPGGYFYLVLPFVKILGLNPLAVRLPNLILSILTIFFLYKLIFLLTKNKNLALISAFILSISPWHIHFSRGGWESSAALSFIVFGVYFFFKSIHVPKSFFLNFLLFVLCFVISLYIYHSARIIAPFLALSLLIFNFKNFKKEHLKPIIISIFFAFITALPVAISFLNNGGTIRFGGVGITADQGPIWRANELINQHHNVKLINRIIHNKRFLYLLSWGQKYASHFDPNFLFLNGDEVPRSKVPGMGQLYLMELPFLLLGIVFLKKPLLLPVLSWLFIAPIASSLTFQAPSALRSLPLTIPLSILIAIGIHEFFKKVPKIAVYLFILIYLFSLIYYLDTYFNHYPKRYPFAWQYGFSELVPYLEKEKDKYNQVFVTNKYDQPYILFLFYSKYSPELIQKEIKLTPPDQFGFSTVKQYNKYVFDKINWESIPVNSLIVASDEILPASPYKIINFPNGQPAFKIYRKI